jgi:cytochrome c553
MKTVLSAALAACGLWANPAAAAPGMPLGRNLAATCANCHGTAGHAQGAMPVLAGLPAERIVAAMAGFKSGALPSTIMGQIAKGYSDEQVALIARYFAQQPGEPAR